MALRAFAVVESVIDEAFAVHLDIGSGYAADVSLTVQAYLSVERAEALAAELLDAAGVARERLAARRAA